MTGWVKTKDLRFLRVSYRQMSLRKTNCRRKVIMECGGCQDWKATKCQNEKLSVESSKTYRCFHRQKLEFEPEHNSIKFRKVVLKLYGRFLEPLLNLWIAISKLLIECVHQYYSYKGLWGQWMFRKWAKLAFAREERSVAWVILVHLAIEEDTRILNGRKRLERETTDLTLLHGLFTSIGLAGMLVWKVSEHWTWSSQLLPI